MLLLLLHHIQKILFLARHPFCRIFSILYIRKKEENARERIKKSKSYVEYFLCFFLQSQSIFFVSHSSNTSRHPPKRKKNSESFIVCVPRSYLRFSLHVYVKKKKTQLRKVTFVMRKCSASHPRLSPSKIKA